MKKSHSRYIPLAAIAHIQKSRSLAGRALLIGLLSTTTPHPDRVVHLFARHNELTLPFLCAHDLISDA